MGMGDVKVEAGKVGKNGYRNLYSVVRTSSAE